MQRVRIGMIGSGFIGRTFANALTLMHDVDLVAVAHGSRAPEFARDLGLALEPSIDALVARPDLDAVVIGLPDHMHMDAVLAAAAAGKHVFVEKPMAATTRDCDRMIQACSDAGVSLGVSKVLRYRGSPKAAKALVDEGSIGTIQMIRVTCSGMVSENNWETKPWHKRVDAASPWTDSASHTNDVVRWMTGQEAVQVYGQYQTFGGGEPYGQSASVVVRLANGVVVDSWLSYELPSPGLPSRYTHFLIIGSEGILDVDAYGKVLLGTGDGWTEVYEQPPFDPNNPRDSSRLAGWAAMYQDFADAIGEGRTPPVTGVDGRAAVEIGEAADLSNATGHAIRLPLVARPPDPVWATWDRDVPAGGSSAVR